MPRFSTIDKIYFAYWQNGSDARTADCGFWVYAKLVICVWIGACAVRTRNTACQSADHACGSWPLLQCTQRLQSVLYLSARIRVFGRSWNFLDPTHYPKCSLSHDAAWVTRCLVVCWFGDILISSSEVSSVACSLQCFQSAFSLIKWLKTISWTSTLAHGSSSKEHRFVIGFLTEVSINVSTPDGWICVCWTFL